jgi:choline dehydrogenase-like flavoprotein
MAKKIYDVIVIGTGAGGGMAIKTLCEAGLKVCALNAGRRLDPGKGLPLPPHAMGYEVPRVGRSQAARRVLRLYG